MNYLLLLYLFSIYRLFCSLWIPPTVLLFIIVFQFYYQDFNYLLIIIEEMKTSKLLKPKQIATLSQKDKKVTRHTSQCAQSNHNYIATIQKLLSKLQSNKVRKILQQLKNTNPCLKQFLHDHRIAMVKTQDILKFQQQYQKMKSQPPKLKTPSSTSGSSSSTRNKNKKNPEIHAYEQIRKGFQKFKQKLQQYQVNDFLTQIKYCSETIDREVRKLDKIGIQYDGIDNIRAYHLLAREIQHDERENGKYQFLTKNQIVKMGILEQAEFKFKNTILDK